MREEIASDFLSSPSEPELEYIELSLLKLSERFGLSSSSKMLSFSFTLSSLPLARVSWALLRTARLWMALRCRGSGINAGGMGSVGGGGGGGVSGRRAIGGGAGSLGWGSRG